MADDQKAGDMDEKEVLTIVDALLANSINKDKTFKAVNMDLERRYNQEPYGNEEPNHSKVVASDVYDTVESDMPAFARVFLGPKNPMEFEPQGGDDDKEAKEKTEYADYLIRRQPQSFKTLHDLLKNPGKTKVSIAHYGMETVETPRYVAYEGISEAELAVHLEELEGQKGVDRVEIVMQDEEGEGENATYNVKFRAIRKQKRIFICAVPWDDFVITAGAESKDTAMIIGHQITKTKGQLVAEGYPKDQVMDLLPCRDPSGNEMKELRFRDQGGYDPATGHHWTNEEVTLENLYPLIDVDNDDIPERRWILRCGETILENEPYGHVPYALFSQILEPHSAIGRSRGEQAARYQLEHTALKRGLYDNIWAVNRPRLAVDDGGGSESGRVNLDDAMHHIIGGLLRTDGPPQNALMVIETPYTGDKALQVIQYLEAEKSVTLGNMMVSQGLDADQLYKETATRFEGVQEAQAAKLELVNRVYAETGMRQLYEGVIWVAQHYQDSTTEFRVLGKQMTVDPRGWQYEHYCASTVGIGSSDSEQLIANLGAMLQAQMRNIEVGSPLADWSKVYNTLVKLTEAMGEQDPGTFWNNPEVPEDVLYAQNIHLNSENLQLKQELMTNGSLAAAEKAKAHASEKTGLAKVALESDKDQRATEVKMRELDLKERELQAKILEVLAEVRKLNSETNQNEVETSMLINGLTDLLGDVQRQAEAAANV